MITTPLKLWGAILTAVLLIGGLMLTAPKGVRTGDAVAGTNIAVPPVHAPVPVRSDIVPEDVFGPNFWAPLTRDGVD